MLPRKILAASLSGMLFCILLGFFLPNPFGESIPSISQYFGSVLLSISGYLLFGIPLILVYGITCSIISEKIAIFLSEKVKFNRSDFFLSGLLHASFGLVFSGYGLVASLLFFAVDRVIKNRNVHVSRKRLIQALVLPIAVYLLCLGTLAAADFFGGGWKDLLV
ncbi:hypothetical protein [Sporosarcina gallistercoris]|uniref:Uncharacterized protein n=1 Tax=Sporosarcina gallistercoris TaxID=2762245 RepID=A0ABR8PHQ2_9BACL|nr:hypothetical protein [Sporosarcina gallistercoris]MBD7907696.1 hypothetical protein [Sporosarcina gallistercoris]